MGSVAAAGVVASGCALGITPPGPVQAQQTPRALAKGEGSADFALSQGTGWCCGWTGYVGEGSVRVRHGLGAGTELGLSAGVLGSTAYSDFEGVGGYPRWISLSAKLDLKVQLHPRLSLVGGAGGGVSPIGGFGTVDLGLLFGTVERRTVEPYGQVRLAASVPVGETGSVEDEDEPGTVEPALYPFVSGGLLIRLNPQTSLALESGAGAVVLVRGGRHHGFAWHFLLGINTRI